MFDGALVAVFLAVLAWALLELFALIYPSRETWARLRREQGRRAVLALRQRIEAAAASRMTRAVAAALAVLVVAWIASASLLDKRWWEVVLDVLPYGFIGGALLRAPAALAAVARRMRGYEQSSGEDFDSDGPLPA